MSLFEFGALLEIRRFLKDLYHERSVTSAFSRASLYEEEGSLWCHRYFSFLESCDLSRRVADVSFPSPLGISCTGRWGILFLADFSFEVVSFLGCT